jgi:ABC-type nickel/cobalt efflux system permease component RcnA
MPDPGQIAGKWSWPRALALAAAIGIRPCTGAVFVLGFALSQGLLWAGVFATFAMALGTALTVSALAAFAVGARELAARYGGKGPSWAGTVRTAAGIAGSAAVMVLGLMLFVGSLGPGSAF